MLFEGSQDSGSFKRNLYTNTKGILKLQIVCIQKIQNPLTLKSTSCSGQRESRM